MRQIGTITTESHARIFRAYLLTLGIHADVEQNRDNQWAIWVHEETRLDEGREELESFLENPKDPRYSAAADTGRKIEKAEKLENEKFQKRQSDLRLKLHMSQMRGGPLTLALIVISVGVTIMMNVPDIGNQVRSLFSIMALHVTGNQVAYSIIPLNEVRHGQIWRLLTPIFLHFGFMHILFNMLWLKLLGGAMEAVEGTWRLAAYVLIFGIISNVVEFFWTGPFFGGMSGVNYGLFAYVWLVGKQTGDNRYYIDNFNIGLMMFWFFACLFGIIPNVANGAHAAGLVLGVIAATIKLRRIPLIKL